MSQFNKYKDYCNKILSSTELDDGSDYDKTWTMCKVLLQKIIKADALKPAKLRPAGNYNDPPLFTTNMEDFEKVDRIGFAVNGILYSGNLNWKDLKDKGCRLGFDNTEHLLKSLFSLTDEIHPFFDLHEVIAVIYCLQGDDVVLIKWRKALVKAMIEWLEFYIEAQVQFDEERMKKKL